MRLHELIRRTLALPEDVVIAGSLGPGSIKDWDSLAHVRLLSAIQTEYGVEVSPEELAAIQNVADIEALLRARGIAE